MMIIISCFAFWLSFKKSVGLCQTLYKYPRDVVIKLYNIVKNDC